jgi:tRNA threonylcarbamoyladenosine biosynthesis protein TsaB
MPIILSIETSNNNCSVCISINGEIAALRENNEGNLHASLLTPFIEAVLTEAGIKAQQLDAVCLSSGPGSYTGLRIGASAAKAICYATGKPLIAVSTLMAMVAGYIAVHDKPNANAIFCPMIDARRMEVYAALYNSQLTELKPAAPWILTEENFIAEYLEKHNIVCLGHGALKGTELLLTDRVTIDGNAHLSALNLVNIAEEKFKIRAFEEIAYFEPIYLKTTPIKQPQKSALFTKEV